MVNAGAVRIYLIRHAETVHNREGLVQGRADNPLSALGLQQAEALASAFAGLTLHGVYASPLRRAQQTAEPLALAHGVAVTVVPDLTEMDIGAMEGLSGPQLRERHPEFLRAWTSETAGSVAMPGGESLEQVQRRAGAALDQIAAATGTGSVAVVSHNFVVLTLLCRALSLPLKDFRRLRHHVAGISMIEVTASRGVVVQVNDTCHLRGAGLLGEDPWQRRG